MTPSERQALERAKDILATMIKEYIDVYKKVLILLGEKPTLKVVENESGNRDR